MMPSTGSIYAIKRIRGQPNETLLKEAVVFDHEVEGVMAKKKAVKADKKTKLESKGTMEFPMIFNVAQRLGGVFGDFSSLEVGISLPIFLGKDGFEAFEGKIDTVMPSVVRKIQKTMNDITVGSGYTLCWRSAQPPPSEFPPSPNQG